MSYGYVRVFVQSLRSVRSEAADRHGAGTHQLPAVLGNGTAHVLLLDAHVHVARPRGPA
ncbi:hypothetical protein STXM2123_4136 [Streptomyces sp. F-3]|nr:hypothetical protein STXM2123_4136 [Streptomyces sp. F-3]